MSQYTCVTVNLCTATSCNVAIRTILMPQHGNVFNAAKWICHRRNDGILFPGLCLGIDYYSRISSADYFNLISMSMTITESMEFNLQADSDLLHHNSRFAMKGAISGFFFFTSLLTFARMWMFIVNEQAMIRNRYNRIPHLTLYTKCDRNTLYNSAGIK